MNNSICFIITSVIEPWTALPFNYGTIRSAFSSEERFSQTCKTIASIHKYAPNADIWLIEGGKSTYLSQIEDIKCKVIYVGKWHLFRRAISSNSKALGEAAMMVYILPYILCSKYKYFFKISGRYYLNNHFDFGKWDFRSICGKDVYGDRHEISTRLIGIPKSKMWLFYKALARRFWKLRGSVYESYLLKGISAQNVHWIEEIGVEGEIGVNKIHIAE